MQDHAVSIDIELRSKLGMCELCTLIDQSPNFTRYQWLELRFIWRMYKMKRILHTGLD